LRLPKVSVPGYNNTYFSGLMGYRIARSFRGWNPARSGPLQNNFSKQIDDKPEWRRAGAHV